MTKSQFPSSWEMIEIHCGCVGAPSNLHFGSHADWKCFRRSASSTSLSFTSQILCCFVHLVLLGLCLNWFHWCFSSSLESLYRPHYLTPKRNPRKTKRYKRNPKTLINTQLKQNYHCFCSCFEVFLEITNRLNDTVLPIKVQLVIIKALHISCRFKKNINIPKLHMHTVCAINCNHHCNCTICHKEDVDYTTCQ